MPVARPHPRTFRLFNNEYFRRQGTWEYILDPRYATSPEHYVRAFKLILKDIYDLFDYVEPADENLPCYSYRIHALLLRVCVEIEANCKAILRENGYTRSDERYWNMTDYKKIEHTHRLSGYRIKVPNWTGKRTIRSPFENWKCGGKLLWYEAYNTTKHDRHSLFHNATFNHLIDATCALLVILSAQFETEDFNPGPNYVLMGSADSFKSGIGKYFTVQFPTDWPSELRYDFNWNKLKDLPEPFEQFDYSKID